MIKNKFRSGFTIVELIVVIAVIGILAGIVLVSYGAWRTSVATSSLKSDLVNAASTMESGRTFDNAYPTTLPSSFSPSSGNTIILTAPDTKSYCLDGTTTQSASIQYYIDDLSRASGATSGTCASRTTLPSPSPVNNIIVTTSSTKITVSWTLPSPNYATEYSAQCSYDQGYITGLLKATASGPSSTSVTLSGANATTTYFCRVRAVNAVGQSDWTNSGAGNTQDSGCADNSQYGVFPDCYNYDALPPGTSIAGYWITAPPPGYLSEDGSAISRTTYADLFAVIGTTYGTGDGSTTFNLPDSRGRVTVNSNPVDIQFDTLGEKYGEKSHTLTIAEMPSHNHGYGSNGQYLTPQGSYYGLTYALSAVATGGNQSHNVIQPSIVSRSAIKFRPSTGTVSMLPTASSIDGYWATLPSGYLPEDGTAVSRTTYADLFAAIGTTYGAGNGSTTFNLPDSRGRTAVNISVADAEFNTMGEKYGEKTHLLTIAEMPSHNHGYGTDGNAYLAPQGSFYGITAVGSPVNTGGGQAHNVIQPSITKRSAIKFSAPNGTFVPVAVAASLKGYWLSVPSGYLPEDGTAVSRTTYADLFAAIGTTYGAGNGSTTFNLPDSRGRTAVNISVADAEFNTMGEKYGEKTHLLTIAEMPSHTHGGAANAASVLVPQGTYYGLTTATPSTYVGGSQSHNVIQPSIVKRFIIKY